MRPNFMSMYFDFDVKGDKFKYFMALIRALILIPGMVNFFLMVFKKIQIFF